MEQTEDQETNRHDNQWQGYVSSKKQDHYPTDQDIWLDSVK